ncbi:Hsp20/alpha crystallin family protein [Methylohalobius crimeensis]|uniref:Hsp20/alpha crystallin family protein n=1 Tax=Methylohalobius crimeensis TaxID=244365 RepID=UPI0003B5AA89|nr:Hsp20/alpha crystallin family protein [Methylohalobius crimeensis]
MRKNNSSDKKGLTGLAGLIEKLNRLGKNSDSDEGRQELNGKRVRTPKIEPPIPPYGKFYWEWDPRYTGVPELLNPTVDVFEEVDRILVIAEVPGVGLEEVDVEINDNALTFEAGRYKRRYRKELLLPRFYSRDQIQVDCNHGLLEIKCLDH